MSNPDPLVIETRIAALNATVSAGLALGSPGDVAAVMEVQADHFWAKAAAVSTGPLRDTKRAQGWRIVADELEKAAKAIRTRLGVTA